MNLDDLLGQATAAVNSQPVDYVDTPGAENVLNQPDIEEPEVLAQEEEEQPPLTEKQQYELFKESAVTAIEFFDFAQRTYLPSAYKKSIFKPGDEEQIAELKKRSDLEAKDLQDFSKENDAFYSLLKRLEAYSVAVEGIKFTDDEKQRLVEPLTKVLKKWGTVQISPEAALLGAVAMVMFPRIEPLFPNVFKGFGNS